MKDLDHTATEIGCAEYVLSPRESVEVESVRGVDNSVCDEQSVCSCRKDPTISHFTRRVASPCMCDAEDI